MPDIQKDESSTEFIHNDKFISSCKVQSEECIKKRFNMPYNQILECGTPRNDIFFNDFSEIAKKVKSEFNIPSDKKCIIYVPTERSTNSNDTVTLDVSGIIEACKIRFGGDFVFLTRAHYLTNDIYRAEDDSVIINVNDYDDMQELICACDVFITDYSSVMWDVSYAKKPCFVFAYGLEEFYKTWAFFMPIERWPFPVSKTMEELKQAIINFDNEAYLKNVQKHYQEMGSFETGTACKQVAQYLISKMEE